jgi:hypothetical protein
LIKKCDHKNCTKAGTCRAPKSRDLRDYWFFCPEHAAEYNKNWNYYADMTADEIDADWERQTFGTSAKDKGQDTTEYTNFINDFLTGRATFDKMPAKKSLPSTIISALKIFDLPITASLREISARYRILAKQHHPDTSHGDSAKFTKITNAYATLKEYYKH